MAVHVREFADFEVHLLSAHRVVAHRICAVRGEWWSWANEVQNWSMNHGSGRFYWDLDRPAEDGRHWSVQYFFTDARSALAFKLRWG